MEVVDGGLKDVASQLFEVLVSPPVPKSTREPLSASSGGGVSSANSNSSGNIVVGGVSGGAGAGSGATKAGSGGALGSASGEGTGGVARTGKGGLGGIGSAQDVAGGVGGGSGGGGGAGGGGGGSQDALVLDYGDVYEGKLYQRRSFVIVNRAAMPLEFQLSSSLPPSELNFSLSAATLKQFKSVHVEAMTRLQARDKVSHVIVS